MELGPAPPGAICGWCIIGTFSAPSGDRMVATSDQVEPDEFDGVSDPTVASSDEEQSEEGTNTPGLSPMFMCIPPWSSLLRRNAFSSSSSLFRSLSAARRCSRSASSSPEVSSAIRRSSFSMCSLVLCLMARWASRSFARFLSSWAALRVVTLRVPAREGRFLVPAAVEEVAEAAVFAPETNLASDSEE